MLDSKNPWSSLSPNQQRKCNSNPKSHAWWMYLADGRYCFRIDFNSIVQMDLKEVKFAGGYVKLLENGSKSTFILYLNENSDLDVFTRFCSVLLDVDPGDGGQGYADSLLRVLVQWMHFLQKIKDSKEIDVRKQIGLLGELTFLRSYLHKTKEIAYTDIIKYWTGPEKAPNDFIFGDVSYEIKCHYYDEDSVHISNEKQLLYLGKPLFLVEYSLKQDEAGMNLEELAAAIREEIIVEDVSLRELFDQKLFLSGFNPAKKYAGLNHYTLSDPLFYEVNEEFPHITKDDSDSAIFSIKYELSLISIIRFLRNDL